MDIKEAVKILEIHNQWRRNNVFTSKYMSTNPTVLGDAIDAIVDYFKPKCDNCIYCDLYEKKNVSKFYFCERTEERISDIEQHYCYKFKKI